MHTEERERITASTKMTMLMVAIIFWLISFIPIVNFFSDFTAWTIFWLWFKFCGASLNKKWKLNVGSALVGLIPIIGTLISAMPYVIFINIKAVQSEDELYNASLRKNSENSNRQTRRERIIQRQQEQPQANGQGSVVENDNNEGVAPKSDGIRRYESKADTQEMIEKNRRNLEPEYKNALEALSNKPDKTREDKILLSRAQEVLSTGQISPADRSEQVLVDAYNQFLQEKIQSRQTQKK
jgi:hypothetical protein